MSKYSQLACLVPCSEINLVDTENGLLFIVVPGSRHFPRRHFPDPESTFMFIFSLFAFCFHRVVDEQFCCLILFPCLHFCLSLLLMRHKTRSCSLHCLITYFAYKQWSIAAELRFDWYWSVFKNSPLSHVRLFTQTWAGSPDNSSDIPALHCSFILCTHTHLCLITQGNLHHNLAIDKCPKTGLEPAPTHMRPVHHGHRLTSFAEPNILCYQTVSASSSSLIQPHRDDGAGAFFLHCKSVCEALDKCPCCRTLP